MGIVSALSAQIPSLSAEANPLATPPTQVIAEADESDLNEDDLNGDDLNENDLSENDLNESTGRESNGSERTEIDQQARLRLYLQRLREDAAAAESGALEMSETAFSFPSLGSGVFDAQLAGYVAYVESFGTPDVLIVGSSRALQGIDPEVLQARLAAQGYPGLTAYNFSVNGATAQVVNFILTDLLPGELPPVVVWGDGSRAFNDGRPDLTWQGLQDSPGFQSVARGEYPRQPQLPDSEPAELGEAASPQANSASAGAVPLDALGFSAVGDRFDPAAYYRQFPRVSGRYDGAYSPFTLQGHQTVALGEVASFVRSQGSQLLFVNLPLSSSYLDEFRLYHEGQFQDFLAAQSEQLGFSVVDLLTQWEGQPGFFADPSHINLHGAAAIADQLAQDPRLLVAITAHNTSTMPLAVPERVRPAIAEPADTVQRSIAPAIAAPTIELDLP